MGDDLTWVCGQCGYVQRDAEWLDDLEWALALERNTPPAWAIDEAVATAPCALLTNELCADCWSQAVAQEAWVVVREHITH